MKWNFLTLAIALAFTAMVTTPAASRDFPDPDLSSAWSNGGTALITPAGSGDTLADVGATVTVTLVDPAGVPWPNYPAQDVWVEGVPPYGGQDGIEPTTVFCLHGNIADGNSDSDGVMTFSAAVAGGGACSWIDVYIVGIPLSQPHMNVAFNSPDINGDLTVDLSDFALFGMDFRTDAFRSDFVFDGVVDLADFSRFGQSYDESCP